MTAKAPEHWVEALRPLLEQRGRSWESLAQSCLQIVLFGSRAAGASRDGSDFDLLCIGSGPSRLSRELDLIFVTPEERHGKQWLGCELARHVAHYGIWLQGEPDWAHKTRYSRSAIEKKSSKIRVRLQSVEEHSALLDVPYLQKYLDLIRRDLQRHQCLIQGEPVPPTPLLDQTWALVSDTWAELRSLAKEAGIDSKFLFDHLSVPERWHAARGMTR